jgi:16S rRNA (uracil1498-N3)-methyltransferase
VNLILFEPAEIGLPLSRADRRAVHLLEVLRRRVGDRFDAGIVNGPRGKGTLTGLDEQALTLDFSWGPPPAELPLLALIVGLPRPQTARDILRDATSLGAGALHFVRTEKSEASYAQSTLWSSGEWRRHLIAGAEQAFETRIPEVTHGLTLADALAALSPTARRVALDNYEATTRLGQIAFLVGEAAVLAFGPERGWSARDRDALRAHGFTLAQLGSRVLRTETAVTAAVAIARARAGFM